MSNKTCNSPPIGAFTRPRYLAGEYVSAAEFSMEQNYRLERLRRHNRLAHGRAVVCGLWVVPGGDATHPWIVRVCPGYAIGPCGDEIELRQAVSIDIQQYLWSLPPSYLTIARFVQYAYVAIRYDEWPDLLTAIPAGGCGCNDPDYQAARTGDGYALTILWTASPAPNPVGICQPDSPPCPGDPASPWLALARIQLPAATSIAIVAAMIDNEIRIDV